MQQIMRGISVAAVGLGVTQAVSAQGVFISEYVEGGANNKAVEIYNGTGSTIDLATYELQIYFNGNPTPATTIDLVGSVAAGDVFVIAHTRAASQLLSEADQASASLSFNGDDAVVLLDGGALTDVIGQIGNDPGSQWGSGLASTRDNTLRRKPAVADGDSNGSDVFEPAVEWEGFAKDTFDDMGVHRGSGGGNTPLPPAGGVVINELDADTAGTDTLEFIELYDGGQGNTDLTGLTVVFYNGGGDAAYQAFDLDGFSTDALGFFVLGNAALAAADIVFGDGALQNGADAVALYQADAVDFPNGTAVTTAGVVDAIVYGTADADDAGLLPLLNAGQPQVDEAGAGDKDTHSSQRCANGEGGARNTVNYVQTSPTPGAANNCASGSVAQLLINEVDADTAGSDVEEFIELYDGGVGDSDLSGRVVVLYNGNGDAVYNAFDLDGMRTDALGYFVLGNAAVANVDLVIGNGALQNGADAVAVYEGNAADFPNGTVVTTNNLVDALVYDTADADDAGLLVLLNAGQPQVDEAAAGDATLHANQRCGNGEGGGRNTAGYTQAAPTPGAANHCAVVTACGAPATFIHAIQGSGTSSPALGAVHTVEGVVIGDFQDTVTGLAGFHIQEESADADGDIATSDGIFVFDNGFGVDVAVGDIVRVTGTVTEFNGLTELNSIANVQVCGTGAAISPTPVTLPFRSSSDAERYEGMLVTFPQTLTVSENFSLGRWGEVTLSSGGRLMQPTNIAAPGAEANAVQAANDLNRVVLDDGSTVQNPDPVLYPAPGLSAFNTLRSGDTTTDLTGVMDFALGVYRVQPTQTPLFVANNPRTLSPSLPGLGALRVASFNVLNYFNGNGQGGGFPTARGADSASEFTRQRDKIVAAISALEADIIGLMELENDGYGSNSAIQDVVNGLNAAAPVGTRYGLIDPGVAQIGTDEIAVGIVYRLETVTPVNGAAIFDGSIDARFDDGRNRPMLTQTFADTAGARLTVAVNHLKSKGSSCAAEGDPDTGDGQGNCNLTRTRAAEAIVDWLATDPTNSNDGDVLIIGDLNAYAKEDPITVMTSAGYTDVIDMFIGAAQTYSFVFQGQSGYLDHALASPPLVSQITGVTEWHINADEPVSLDYNEEFKSGNQIDLFYNGDAYRASDHDPVIVELNLH